MDTFGNSVQAPSGIALRRARPSLGTFVEITAHHEDEGLLSGAISRGFQAIERVQALLSRFDASSVVSQLATGGLRGEVRLDPWAVEVFSTARSLWLESEGLFDPCYGSSPGALVDLQILDRDRVEIERPIACDLGGIAKGFAVDRALDVLRDAGCSSGSVNAGGDLRVFGPEGAPLHIRHPGDPRGSYFRVDCGDCACASSGSYNLREEFTWNGIQSPHGGTVSRERGVSVFAPTCMIADALTKVVILDENKAEQILASHKARALVLTAAGAHYWIAAYEQ